MWKSMIRKLLEEQGLKMSDQEFSEVMTMATQDIKFNNVSFKKRTSLDSMLVIVQRCFIVIGR
jgi:hypothetical protein